MFWVMILECKGDEDDLMIPEMVREASNRFKSCVDI
jgi:hypothetical protein